MTKITFQNYYFLSNSLPKVQKIEQTHKKYRVLDLFFND